MPLSVNPENLCFFKVSRKWTQFYKTIKYFRGPTLVLLEAYSLVLCISKAQFFIEIFWSEKLNYPSRILARKLNEPWKIMPWFRKKLDYRIFGSNKFGTHWHQLIKGEFLKESRLKKTQPIASKIWKDNFCWEWYQYKLTLIFEE